MNLNRSHWKMVDKVTDILRAPADKKSRQKVLDVFCGVVDEETVLTICRISVKRYLDNQPESGLYHCQSEKKCNGKLVLRKNKETGENFFGCNRFPKCKHTQRTRYHDQKDHWDLVKSAAPYVEEPFYLLFPRSIAKAVMEEAEEKGRKANKIKVSGCAELDSCCEDNENGELCDCIDPWEGCEEF